jgi:uncharacterized protein (DUF427 family)
MKATVNGTIVAESNETVVVEGNHYFPPSSIKAELFSPTQHTTVCSWKGTANYYDVTVDGQTLTNVAWYYADPKDAAAEIRDYVAFYPKVSVTD